MIDMALNDDTNLYAIMAPNRDPSGRFLMKPMVISYFADFLDYKKKRSFGRPDIAGKRVYTVGNNEVVVIGETLPGTTASRDDRQGIYYLRTAATVYGSGDKEE